MNNIATLKKIVSTNLFDYMAKAEKVWVLILEDGSYLSTYPTKIAAMSDAKKYNLTIVHG